MSNSRFGGHMGSAGPKIKYRSEAAVQEAVALREAEGIRHDGRPWRGMRTYRCDFCSGWHITTTSWKRYSPNFMGGGWARDYLIIDIEIGSRAARNLRSETETKRVSGLDSLRRRIRRGELAAPHSQLVEVGGDVDDERDDRQHGDHRPQPRRIGWHNLTHTPKHTV